MSLSVNPTPQTHFGAIRPATSEDVATLKLKFTENPENVPSGLRVASNVALNPNTLMIHTPDHSKKGIARKIERFLDRAALVFQWIKIDSKAQLGIIKSSSATAHSNLFVLTDTKTFPPERLESYEPLIPLRRLVSTNPKIFRQTEKAILPEGQLLRWLKKTRDYS
jgi:cellulose biosynthesis protein BcsQ